MLLLSREGTAPLIRREDYAPPAYWIREADLTFDLDGAKTLVASKLRVERNASLAALPPQPLRLHGEGLTLLRVMADGQSVSFRHEAEGSLVIDNPPATESWVFLSGAQVLRISRVKLSAAGGLSMTKLPSAS